MIQIFEVPESMTSLSGLGSLTQQSGIISPDCDFLGLLGICCLTKYSSFSCIFVVDVLVGSLSSVF